MTDYKKLWRSEVAAARALCPSVPSPWSGYLKHFEANVVRPLPSFGTAHRVPTDVARPLAEILARFQLGESGEGRLARQIDRARLGGADTAYREALKLVVREEGRHGRVLGLAVRALGGQLLRRKASNTLFTWARRFVGVRFKLAVVVVAEVVGDAVYAALRDRLVALECGGDVAAALTELAADEAAHLRFHADFMQVLTRGGQGPWERARRALLRAGLRALVLAVGVAANGVVLLENYRGFGQLGLSPWTLAREIAARLAAARVSAFGQRPDGAVVRGPSAS